MERFGTNEKCHDYLVSIRWQGKPKCSKCGNDNKNYYLTSRKIYKCSDCYHQFSVTQGTIFERSKVPLPKWFLAIYHFTTFKRNISSCQLAKLLDVKQQTAWFILQRLREAVREENEIVLSGLIEADETFVGPDTKRDTRIQKRRKNHYAKQEAIHGMLETKKRHFIGAPSKVGRKKGSTKEVLEQKKLEQKAKGERKPFERGAIIFGMMERRGRLVMKKIGHNRKCLTKKNIYPLLNKYTTRDSVLFTDESTIYIGTVKFFSDHLSVNHQEAYVINGVHINGIENAWNHFKRMVKGTYFHLSRRHFDRYLNENTFRWNRQYKPCKEIFEEFMPLISNKRISYKQLTAKEESKKAA